jgi:hypothetical protein
MAHHLAGMSNSAKRRQAEADAHQAVAESNDGMLSVIANAGADACSAMQTRFRSLCSFGKEKAVEMERAVEKQIQHRPIISVLGALGLGVIFGSICTMACNRK